jgi:hypothetical protein
MPKAFSSAFILLDWSGSNLDSVDVFSFLQALCSDAGKTCHEAMKDRKQGRNRAR